MSTHGQPKRKLNDTIIQSKKKKVKVVQDDTHILDFILREQAELYKEIVHPLFTQCILNSTGRDQIINILREKQLQKHKWEKEIYANIVQHILPFLVNNATKKKKDVVHLFRLNKYWHSILKPSLWISYFSDVEIDFREIRTYIKKHKTNCTIFQLQTLTIKIVYPADHNDFIRLGDALIQYLTQYKQLKTIHLRLGTCSFGSGTKEVILPFYRQLASVILHSTIQIHVHYINDDWYFESEQFLVLDCFHSIYALNTEFNGTIANHTFNFNSLHNLRELTFELTQSNISFYELLLGAVGATLVRISINMQEYMVPNGELYKQFISFLQLIQGCPQLTGFTLEVSHYVRLLYLLPYLPKHMELCSLLGGRLMNLNPINDNSLIFPQVTILCINSIKEEEIQYIPILFPQVTHLTLGCCIVTKDYLQALKKLPLVNLELTDVVLIQKKKTISKKVHLYNAIDIIHYLNDVQL